jgi:hypothetical protein
MNTSFSKDDHFKSGRIYIEKKKHKIDQSILKDLEKIDTLEGATIIHCHYTAPKKYINGGWINISPSTYLIDKSSSNMLKMTQVEGIPLSPSQHHFSRVYEKKTFTLFFPALPKSWEMFTLMELIDSDNPWVKHDIPRNNSGVYHLNIH